MDPLFEISLSPPQLKHFGTLFPFLRRALLPEPSSNRNPGRFDTALAESLVNPTSHTTILDLGCGDWMLFEKLLQLHHTGSHGHLQAPCKYIGIDSMFDYRSRKWQQLKETCCRVCFPDPDYRQFNVTQHDTLRDFLRQQATSLDYVFLCNVLHELPPNQWLKLFALLFEFLSPTGQLVVIDPDLTWCFSPKAWECKADDWHLEHIPVEWETDAVWFSRDAISDVLRSLGFAATVHYYERNTMNLWKATGSRPTPADTPNMAAGVQTLRSHVEQQVALECERISQLREELRERFRSNAYLSGELLVKTFEFFAACASQCRRLEALQEIPQ